MFEIVTVPANAPRSQEQMGTKRKFWYDDATHGLCLFKEARPNTGEDWAEKIAEQVCQCLNIPHARYELAEWEGRSGTVTLPINGEGERLIHGNEFLQQTVMQYQQSVTRRGISRLHTINNVLDCLQPFGVPKYASLPAEMTTAQDVFVGYLMLDALVGNADRHHENWGCIARNNGTDTRLAPTFDHAASLGRELTDARRQTRLTTRDQNQTVAAYARKGRSALFLTPDDVDPLTLINAFQEIAKRRPDAAHAWLAQLRTLTVDALKDIGRKMPTNRLSASAFNFALEVMQYNQQQLLALAAKTP